MLQVGRLLPTGATGSGPPLGPHRGHAVVVANNSYLNNPIIESSQLSVSAEDPLVVPSGARGIILFPSEHAGGTLKFYSLKNGRVAHLHVVQVLAHSPVQTFLHCAATRLRRRRNMLLENRTQHSSTHCAGVRSQYQRCALALR